MGFGDVTLMAMIGAFLGWQAALIAFFIAPFTALFIAVAQWLATRRHELAFGPYLCAGALIVLLRWPEIWSPPLGVGVRPNFQLGWFIPGIVVVCLGLMWVMLWALRSFRERFAGEDELPGEAKP
jgi:Flp pilus assembly protein protease CpaA